MKLRVGSDYKFCLVLPSLVSPHTEQVRSQAAQQGESEGNGACEEERKTHTPNNDSRRTALNFG